VLAGARRGSGPGPRTPGLQRPLVKSPSQPQVRLLYSLAWNDPWWFFRECVHSPWMWSNVPKQLPLQPQGAPT
jgi:hypothetical protein